MIFRSDRIRIGFGNALDDIGAGDVHFETAGRTRFGSNFSPDDQRLATCHGFEGTRGLATRAAVSPRNSPQGLAPLASSGRLRIGLRIWLGLWLRIWLALWLRIWLRREGVP